MWWVLSGCTRASFVGSVGCGGIACLKFGDPAHMQAVFGITAQVCIGHVSALTCVCMKRLIFGSKLQVAVGTCCLVAVFAVGPSHALQLANCLLLSACRGRSVKPGIPAISVQVHHIL
jgi:hypothetical protein